MLPILRHKYLALRNSKALKLRGEKNYKLALFYLLRLCYLSYNKNSIFHFVSSHPLNPVVDILGIVNLCLWRLR